MPNLGAPLTNKFIIGTFEVRVGPLNKAGLLTQKHSVGITQNFSLNVEQNSIDLKAGFPQQVVDTAITEQVAGMTANLTEYSKRNIELLLGGAANDYPNSGTDAFGTVDTTNPIAANAVSFTFSTVSGTFAANDTIVLYNRDDLSACIVSTVATYVAGTKTVTLTTGQGLATGFPAGSVVFGYKADPIKVGNVTGVNYFTVQLINQDRGTGRVQIWDFWKAAISSGIELGANVTEFANTDLQLKFLAPAASEYAVGGNLAHLANVVPTNPIGRIAMVRDVL